MAEDGPVFRIGNQGFFFVIFPAGRTIMMADMPSYKLSFTNPHVGDQVASVTIIQLYNCDLAQQRAPPALQIKYRSELSQWTLGAMNITCGSPRGAP